MGVYPSNNVYMSISTNTNYDLLFYVAVLYKIHRLFYSYRALNLTYYGNFRDFKRENLCEAAHFD